MTFARSGKWPPILAAAVSAIAVASLGASITVLGPWYYSLQKPNWQPPDWLFGPAWTIIFALAAAAGVSAWRGARSRRDRRRIIWLFLLNSSLNVFWSFLFFRLHRPDLALYEVGFLWLSILLLIVGLAPMSRTSSWLVAPYLAWVTFAAILNFEVVRLNPPFTGS